MGEEGSSLSPSEDRCLDAAYRYLLRGDLATRVTAFRPVEQPYSSACLVLMNPADSSPLLPGETMPLVLGEAHVAFLRKSSARGCPPVVFVQDSASQGRLGAVATILRLVVRDDDAIPVPGAGDVGNGGWPSCMAVVRAMRCATCDLSKIELIDGCSCVCIEDVEMNSQPLRHNLSDFVRQNMTVIDSRLSVNLCDEGELRWRLISWLETQGYQSMLCGFSFRDPSLSLLDLLAVVFSILGDDVRSDLQRLIIGQRFGDILQGLVGHAEKSVQCARCRRHLCSALDLIPNQHTFHINRYGYACRLLLCDGFGQPYSQPTEESGSLQDTWFQGYAWSALDCGFCGQILGWRFQRAPEDRASDPPRQFFGLVHGLVVITN